MRINRVCINPINMAIFYSLRTEELMDIFSSYHPQGVLRIEADKDVPTNVIRLMLDDELVEDIELEVFDETDIKLPTSH